MLLGLLVACITKFKYLRKKNNQISPVQDSPASVAVISPLISNSGKGSVMNGTMAGFMRAGSMERSMARSMAGSMAIVMAGSDQGSLVSSSKFKPSFNIVSSNNSMISYSTVFIGSAVILSIFVFWTIYVQIHASDIVSTFYYTFSIVFFLLLNVTPPLYFFNRLGSFKIALSIARGVFIWNTIGKLENVLMKPCTI